MIETIENKHKDDYVKMRLGDIAFENCNNVYEIVKWFPNEYYNREKDFELVKLNSINGDTPTDDEYVYTPKGDGYGSIIIDKSCFKDPETCYVLATFTIDDEGGNLIWCGSRPLNLTKKEWLDFIECVKFGYDHIKRIINDDDNDV
jgi:hypothetical protein